jgi:hypothetical protein
MREHTTSAEACIYEQSSPRPDSLNNLGVSRERMGRLLEHPEAFRETRTGQPPVSLVLR